MEQTSEREAVLNAFQPGLAIEIPSKFAGRKQILGDLADAIRTEGLCPLIFGEQGLGKSSIANQLARIALGDVELLTTLGYEDRCLPEEERFVVFQLQCTDDVMDVQQLLQRLINLAAGLVTLPASGELRRTGIAVEQTVKLYFYEAKLKEEYEARNRLEEYLRLSVEERLLACIDRIADQYGRRVLLIIDELDQVHSTKGLASFIKSSSSALLKFVLVGVAHDYSTMLADHSSLERILYPLKVARMRDDELKEVVDRVEEFLQGRGIRTRFSRDAKAILVRSSLGLPWYTHVIGRESLLGAYENEQELIGSDEVLAAIDSLSANALARHFEDLYLRAASEAYEYEVVLRLFAKWNTGSDIPTSEIHPIAETLGVVNPSLQTAHLCRSEYGAVLKQAPFSRHIYSFRNALFQQYVNLRHSLFEGAKERVDQEWIQSRT